MFTSGLLHLERYSSVSTSNYVIILPVATEIREGYWGWWEQEACINNLYSECQEFLN